MVLTHDYDQPANEKLGFALWRVSKQLLRAEQVPQSHVELLETIQVDVKRFDGPRMLHEPNWLRQELKEFKRLSDEEWEGNFEHRLHICLTL